MNIHHEVKKRMFSLNLKLLFRCHTSKFRNNLLLIKFRRNAFKIIYFSCSYLYIARSQNPTIQRYDPSSESTDVFNNDGSAQSITFDQHDNAIYWVNYDSTLNKFMVMRTQLNNQTVELNITYTGDIKVTSDVLYIYILDTENSVIDKYLKTSLEKEGNITSNIPISDLIIAYGESQVHFFVN